MTKLEPTAEEIERVADVLRTHKIESAGENISLSEIFEDAFGEQGGEIAASLMLPALARAAILAMDRRASPVDEDAIEVAITDSLDVDWTPRDGAREVMWVLRRASPPAPASLPEGSAVIPIGMIQSCNGEQEHFEAWAKSRHYDMHEHPLHYLFLNEKTDAARQGWKAALEYARDLCLADAPQPPATLSYEEGKRPEVNDGIAILRRLADGDSIAYSQDGDRAWFTKGDRAFVGNAIITLRQKGLISRQCDDEENYRGSAEYDTISAAGRAHLATAIRARVGQLIG